MDNARPGERPAAQTPDGESSGAGIAWNLTAFAALGVSGVFINLFLGATYGPTGLGVFNQVYAFFILLAQVTTLGVQWSVLRHVAQHRGEHPELGHILLGAIVVVLAVSIPVSVAALFAADAMEALFDSADVAAGYRYVLLGLVFFSINKLLINALSSMRRFRAFSLVRGFRVLLLASLIVTLAMLDAPAALLPASLSVTEMVLSVVLLGAFAPVLRTARVARAWAWVPRHCHFGLRSMLGGAGSEINTRVDVLVLGVFVSDRMVGIYSIAGMLFEGMVELMNVLRFVINPELPRLVAAQGREAFARFASLWMRRGYLLAVGAGLVAVACFPILPEYVLRDPAFMGGWYPFAILVLGLGLTGGYRIFDMVLVQGGAPGAQTILRVMVVLTNLCANLLLVPAFGIVGAAAGTTLAMVAGVGYLKWLARRSLALAI